MKVSTSGQKTGDGDVNLGKSSMVQLKELLDRQEKILNNRSFINKLPDKGDRIRKFKKKIQSEMTRRDVEVDETAQLLSRVNLQDIPVDLEWRRSVEGHVADSDDSDDEPHPLQLLANHSGTQQSVQVKTSSTPPLLITTRDLEEAKVLQNTSYSEKLCHKYERSRQEDRFKPSLPRDPGEGYRTGYRASSERVQSRLGGKWEVTAATPPIPRHDSVKSVTLAQSLELQQQQADKLKEIQLLDAMSRLRDPQTLRFGPSLPTNNLMAYRTIADPAHVFEGTPVRGGGGEEVEQEMDGEGGEGTAVIYNVVDDVP